jgi:hypothetical protein
MRDMPCTDTLVVRWGLDRLQSSNRSMHPSLNSVALLSVGLHQAYQAYWKEWKMDGCRADSTFDLGLDEPVSGGARRVQQANQD